MRTGYIALLLCGGLFAQNTAPATGIIASAGYVAPMNFLKAAPGQVISLMVYGLDGRLDHPMTATGTPLPLRLAGFSVSFQQDATTVPVPLLGISQQACAYPNAGAGLCESLTVISMQVPFELQTDCPLCGRPPNLNFFVVADAGVPKTMAAATVAGDNIHITDNCDTTAQFSQNSGTHLRQNRRARRRNSRGL